MNHIKYFLIGLGVFCGVLVPWVVGFLIGLWLGQDAGASIFIGISSYFVVLSLAMFYGIGRDICGADELGFFDD